MANPIGCMLPSPRSLVLPLLALIAIAALHVPAQSASKAVSLTSCGPVVAVYDAEIRHSFARFDRNQSAAARRICTIYRGNEERTIR
jgi:hypothetical protein